MTEIIEGIWFFAGVDDMIPDSHVYVVGEPSSRDLSIIDAGLMGKSNYKLQSIRKAGIEFEDIKRVIMTHTHLDHIGCLKEIREKFPWLELWVHNEEAESLEQGDERTVYGMEMFRNMCQMQYGLKDGDFKFAVNKRLKGNETLEIGGMVWEVLHIPGHSPGGIALYHRTKRVLIPGDVVYADYAIGRFDLHGASASALRESLARLSELEVDILLPGHNRIARDLPKGYLEQTARQWESYLV